jgi:plastocyanin
MPIDFPSDPAEDDTYTDGTTTWTFDGTAWNVTAGAGGGGGGSSNSFQTISVSGQSDVVADSATDTLTLVAGSNVTITTDATTDSITIASTGGGGGGGSSNSFETIAVSGQSSLVADSATDTLTVVAGTGISLTTDAATDTLTITNTQAGGITNFSALTDASNASLTVDQIYLPAITKLMVNNVGTTAYTFDQWSGNNPAVYAISGTTIAFDLSGISGHPFQIQDPTGTNYDTGLIHVASDGTVSTGADAQGKTSGTLYWKVPGDISGTYRYQCATHAGMVGQLVVKAFAAI